MKNIKHGISREDVCILLWKILFLPLIDLKELKPTLLSMFKFSTAEIITINEILMLILKLCFGLTLYPLLEWSLSKNCCFSDEHVGGGLDDAGYSPDARWVLVSSLQTWSYNFKHCSSELYLKNIWQNIENWKS